MRNRLDALLTERSLRLASLGAAGELGEYLRENHPDIQPMLRQTCAKLTVELAEEIDRVCEVLGMSKRQFIEAALIDAVRRAHEIMDQEGVTERLRSNAQLQAATAGLAGEV